MSYQLYRASTIGQALQDTINEYVTVFFSKIKNVTLLNCPNKILTALLKDARPFLTNFYKNNNNNNNQLSLLFYISTKVNLLTKGFSLRLYKYNIIR